uniref:uncharacterized protein LOC122586721 n=1 Tax=Erigeron canadensis TaxID=72917 RepID=UPI001CB94ABE|nr:uncharacterized protein LOC122586721 [Erigeron canadensis]
METLSIPSISSYQRTATTTTTTLFKTKQLYQCSFSPISFPPSNFSTLLLSRPTNKRTLSKSSSSEETNVSTTDDDDAEWVKNLPDKKKPLYSHSLPCIEGWLKNELGFNQSNEDRAVWFVEKSDWHAKLSLDVTDLYIRYLKSGPGNLDKDVERRFSYALSREDIENAILGGP